MGANSGKLHGRPIGTISSPSAVIVQAQVTSAAIAYIASTQKHEPVFTVTVKATHTHAELDTHTSTDNGSGGGGGHVSNESYSFELHRRYEEFNQLYHTLKSLQFDHRQHVSHVAIAPSVNSPSFLSDQSVLLNDWIRKLLSNAVLSKQTVTILFFTQPSEFNLSVNNDGSKTSKSAREVSVDGDDGDDGDDEDEDAGNDDEVIEDGDTNDDADDDDTAMTDDGEGEGEDESEYADVITDIEPKMHHQRKPSNIHHHHQQHHYNGHVNNLHYQHQHQPQHQQHHVYNPNVHQHQHSNHHYSAHHQNQHAHHTHQQAHPHHSYQHQQPHAAQPHHSPQHTHQQHHQHSNGHLTNHQHLHQADEAFMSPTSQNFPPHHNHHPHYHHHSHTTTNSGAGSDTGTGHHPAFNYHTHTNSSASNDELYNEDESKNSTIPLRSTPTPTYRHTPTHAGTDSGDDRRHSGSANSGISITRHSHSQSQSSITYDMDGKSHVTVRLRDFHLLKVIGKGSFGKVLLVKKIDSGAIYAMKVLNKEAVIKRNQVEHTRTERSVLAYLRHPNIVALRFAFQTRHKLYFVLDYMPGGELFFHLGKAGKFTEDRAKFYTAQIVLALEHLHENAVIYRDLKPENVLLDKDGNAKITDFGLSKEGVSDNCSAHSFCGTPEYLAPEILLRTGHGRAADWWSLGAILYEMVVGMPPFYSRQREKLFNKILSSTLKLPKSLSKECSHLLIALLDRNPNTRIGSVRDAAEIKAHPFFTSIDWQLLSESRLEPPFRPQLQHFTDTNNFDAEFTSLPLHSHEEPAHIHTHAHAVNGDVGQQSLEFDSAATTNGSSDKSFDVITNGNGSVGEEETLGQFANFSFVAP